MFSQLLAQQIVCNYSIDLVNGIESVPNPGLNINFSRDIIIKAKKKALEAKKISYRKYFFG